MQIKGSTKDLGRLRIQDIEIGKQSEICVEKDVNIKRVKTYNSNKACLGWRSGHYYFFFGPNDYTNTLKRSI